MSALLLLSSCTSGTDNDQPSEASPGRLPGVTAAMEIFEVVDPTEDQLALVRRIVQTNFVMGVVECVQEQGFQHDVVAWPQPVQESTDIAIRERLQEVGFVGPLGFWYSPVDPDFVETHGFNAEKTFLNAVVSTEAGLFREAQGASDDAFAAQSAAHDDALSSCSESADVPDFTATIPELSVTLSRQWDENLTSILAQTGLFESWPECMRDRGYELQGPGQMFSYLLDSFGGDPYPSNSAPFDGTPGELWLESRDAEVALAVADADCRRAAITSVDGEFLSAAEDFRARNADSLAQLPSEWDSLRQDFGGGES